MSNEITNKEVNAPAHNQALASLILGIASCVLIFFGAFAFLGVASGIVGIVMANKAKAAGNEEGIRKAGFVTSIIGTVVSALVFLFVGLIFGSVFTALAGAAM